jgi:glycosyltransferase involved in cell wall biosynthesis
VTNRTGDDAPLHVGLYSPALPDSGNPNGIVTYVRILRDALISLGHEVTVVTQDQIVHPDGSVAGLSRPTRLQVLRERLRGRVGSYPRARVANAFRSAVQAGVDIFEMEESFGWAGRLKGVPVVMRLHGPHCFVGNDDPDRVRSELAAFSRVAAVISPTQRLLEAMAERASWSIGRVIPNPMPLPREQWSLDRADPDQLLFIGRMDRIKGADVVMRAFAQAREKRPELRLVMVGPGDMPCALSGIDVKGKLSPAEILELRLRSALSVVGSPYETFAYSITEAMALGMPVLSTDSMGGRALVDDRVTGRLAPVGDPEAMSAAMLEMTGDRGALAAYGRAARAWVAEQLDPERIARESVVLYREVLARR